MMTRTAIALLGAIALALSACGNDSSDDSSSRGAAAASAATVSVETVDGVGEVLVDSSGAALYTTDQEEAGRVACMDECALIWLPLEAGQGRPSGADGVGERLGVVTRPDGGRQVTLDGQPLYRFAEDGAGEVTGDGLADSFGGRRFVWHVATAAADSGAAPASGRFGY